jgi:predicted DNA-binding protein
MLTGVVILPTGEPEMKKAKGGTRTSLSLPNDLYARLQAEQQRTGAPLAEIVRRAIDGYLTPREQAARKGSAR